MRAEAIRSDSGEKRKMPLPNGEKFWYNNTQLILAERKASKHIRKFDTGGKKKMKKRILSIVLAVLMLVSVLPI